MKKLLIIGNGEIASMAYEYFTHDSDYEVAAFAVGAAYIKEAELYGLPVVSLEEMVKTCPPENHEAFVAIGDVQLNRVRRSMFEAVRELGYDLATYVSSRASVWHNVKIGKNCFIFENNVLQPYVEIGDNVILWSGNHIGHRSVIEDDVFVSSHVVISGYCRIGRSTFIGVNAAVGNLVSIAADNFIGMGAVVTQSTEADQIYQGNPAEPRKISAKRFCKVRT